MTMLDEAVAKFNQALHYDNVGCDDAPMYLDFDAIRVATRDLVLAAIDECEHLDPSERCATCITQDKILRLFPQATNKEPA